MGNDGERSKVGGEGVPPPPPPDDVGFNMEDGSGSAGDSHSSHSDSESTCSLSSSSGESNGGGDSDGDGGDGGGLSSTELAYLRLCLSMLKNVNVLDVLSHLDVGVKVTTVVTVGTKGADK